MRRALVAVGATQTGTDPQLEESNERVVFVTLNKGGVHFQRGGFGTAAGRDLPRHQRNR